MNQNLYLLYHAYEINGHEEIKILGIYTSPENAEQAKQRYLHLEGFREFPAHCFWIQRYAPNKDDAWTDGFFTEPESVLQSFRKLSAELSAFLELPDNWENQEYFELLQEISWKLSVSDDIADIAEYLERFTADRIRKAKPEYLRFAHKILNL